MEQFYAVQWQNPETKGWEVCQGLSTLEIYLCPQDAQEVCADWSDEDTNSTYRVATIKFPTEVA